MIKTQTQPNERARLDALMSYKILDSFPENDFDAITKLASEICETPISLITLVDKDRQWFKSRLGIDLSETKREYSFCAHAIKTPEENFVVENPETDLRFFDNPFVTDAPFVKYYAGVPLVDADGFALGTLCVIDTKPKKLSDFQLHALEILANQVMKLMELHKTNNKLVENHNTLLTRYKDLEQFSSVVSHDLKSPLNNITQFTKMFKEDYGQSIDPAGNLMLDYIEKSSEELKKLVDGILNYYKYDNLNLEKKEKIRLKEFSEYIITLLKTNDEFEFILPDPKAKLFSNRIALGQILYNLIGNSIKYNDKAKGIIEIIFEKTDGFSVITVKDNGSGIAQENFEKVFEVFQTLGKTDRFQSKGTGLGLSTVKKMVDKLDGTIELQSVPGQGAEFKMYLRK